MSLKIPVRSEEEMVVFQHLSNDGPFGWESLSHEQKLMVATTPFDTSGVVDQRKVERFIDREKGNSGDGKDETGISGAIASILQ